jgi:valyl-tRNA synthetase
MRKEIEKTYEPANVESRHYRKWMDSGYFHAEPDPSKEPFCIVIPPPNITGQLHMGHALDNTMQDILTRFKRMRGYCTLWLPGTDHASIATEVKIVEKLASEGLTKSDVGREGFIELAWEWRNQYGGRIVEQLKRLGSSCDWERERFTMDSGCSKAVREVFVRLHEKGLIYRGERIINWCPSCRTSISDAEVEYEEKEGHFWHILYPVKDQPGQFVEIATTRPETMLGDTAVAVHPGDPRYAALVGRTLILPLLGREIPVIEDTYVEQDFGTGAVKITPAHDQNDFEVGIRHQLPVINVMTEDARINDAGCQYAGMDRYEARRRIVADLEALGLLVQVKPHRHNVGACYRCSTVIEPRASRQWFVRMKPLAEPAIAAVLDGTIRFVPERFSKTYFNWMDNIKDWCISRQLWWGHRIPAWHCDACGHITVSRTDPEACEKCGERRIRQDEDVLDTWFSSALWPFSTLGWPDRTADLDYFYPTSVLVTGYDIIFFWVARMIFSGIEQMGREPFGHVLMHGLVRDAQGSKMSKSLGNGIDPLEVIDRYGTDALRYALTIGTAPGNDMRFSEEKLESSRNFCNKIWNAFRFVMMNFDENADLSKADPVNHTIADKWILSRLNTVAREVTESIDKYDLSIGLQKIYEFIWEEFCDWYIEMVKPRLYESEAKGRLEALQILNGVLRDAMKLLHPYMPFISEEIYSHLATGDDSIMISPWPVYTEGILFPEEERTFSTAMDIIRGIRNVRAEMNIPTGRKAKAILVTANQALVTAFATEEINFKRLASLSGIQIQPDRTGIDDTAVSIVADGAEVYLPLADLVDLAKETERLEKERANLMCEVERVGKKLGNEGFVSKAPAAVIEAERAKELMYRGMLGKIEERIDGFKKAMK